MQTKTNFGKLKERIFVTRALKSSLAALGIFILGFIIAPALIAEANATRALGEIDWESVSLTLDPDVQATRDGTSTIEDEGHGDVDFGTITPSHSSDGNQGTMKVKKKIIGVETSGKYFTIYLSTTSSSNGLNLVTTVNGTPTQNTAYNIPAIASEWSDPSHFGNYASWGYAVPGTTITTDEEIDGQIVHHPSFPVPSLVDQQIFPSTPGTDASQTYNDTLWAPVATTADPQQIWKKETSKSKGFGYDTQDQDVDTNNTLEIYYGLMVNTDVLAGTYENNIVYTALASTTSLDRVSSNIHHSKSFGGKGDEVKIRFDLKDSTDSVTRSMVHVAMVPHSVMASHFDSVTSSYTDVSDLHFSDYNECVVTSLTHPTGENAHKYIDLTCNMPAGEEGSQYDFWVNVNGYNYNYISKTMVGEGANAELAASFTYAGLQTKWPTADPRYDENAADPLDNLVVKNMQDMTNGICNLTNAWGNTTSLDSKLFGASGTGQEVVADIYTTVPIIDEQTGEPTGETETVVDQEATLRAKNALGVGSFKLIDNRDQHPYLVRRLADGNCWMVENLDIELSTSGTLTPENSDISEDWDPYESSGGPENFAAYSLAQVGQYGSGQQYQYQPYGVSGLAYFWGSRKNVAGDIIVSTSEDINTPANADSGYSVYRQGSGTGVFIEVNERATIPRSLNNRYDYVGLTEENSAGNSAGPYNSGTDVSWNANHASTYVGQYYNWYAATAESGLWEAASSSQRATASICPLGWTLPPINGENRSWGHLLFDTYKDTDGATMKGDAKTATAMLRIPLSIARSGGYNSVDGNVTQKGAYGYFWSTIPNSKSNVRRMYFRSDTAAVSNSAAKVDGNSIRCVSHGTENQVTPPEDVVQSTCAANSICYDANGGTGDTMANTGSATFGSSKVLSAPTYTRTGYAFVGWSESKDAVQSGAYIYGPNETITVPNLSSEGMTLYAQWLAPENSSYTMQAFGRNETVKTCATMTDGNNGTTEERIALRDERDDNVYIVTKLKDGNCWMTSNLALNLADFAGKTTGTLLTPENTDLTASREDLSTLTIEGVGGGQTTVEYYDPAKSVREKIANGKVTNDPEETRTIADALDARNLTHDFAGYSELVLGQRQETQFQSLNQNTWYWGSIVSDDGNFSQTNAQYAIEVSQNANTEMPRSYNPGDNKTTGNYYNWYAATAEAGTYAMIGAQASDSICPSGWMLPSAYAGKDANNISYKSYYNLLHNDYNLSSHSIASSKILRSQPVSFSLPGYYNVVPGSGGSRIVAENSTSHYWSSSATNQDFTAYYTRVGSSSTDNNVFVASYPNGYKAFGFSIRCVKK